MKFKKLTGIEATCDILTHDKTEAAREDLEDERSENRVLKDGSTTDQEMSQICTVQSDRDGASTISLCTCRICQTAKSKEALISPCYCKGTLGKVHLSCLERWLNMCGRQHCEICRYQFEAKRKRRYTICQAIRYRLHSTAEVEPLYCNLKKIAYITQSIKSDALAKMDEYASENLGETTRTKYKL